MQISELGKLFLVEGTKAFIASSVKEFVTEKVKPWFISSNEVDEWLLNEEIMNEYLQIAYNNIVMVNTIMFSDTPKPIFDLYIPLYIMKKDNYLDENEINELYKIGDNPEEEVFDKYNRVLIIDTAGMGKSTLVRYLFIKQIEDKQRIPIIIELRKIKKEVGLIKHIQSQFNLLDKEINENEIIKMLRRGDFIIFFDGYDEISEDVKEALSEDMINIIKKASRNLYIITSREESLSNFGDFQKFTIKPLEIEEAFQLIKKYGKAGGSRLEKRANDLIDAIKEDEQFEIIKDLLSNPLLVSLLFKSYLYKGEIPYKKSNFYRQTYEALFNDHDKIKDDYYIHVKSSKLDSDDFATVLRALGYVSLKNDSLDYTREELVSLIREALNLVPQISVKESDFLKDITHAVPIFLKEGTNYKWIHKSFVEYFAAGFICFECNEYKNKIIDNMIEAENNIRFENVLDFCYELDTKTCRKLMVYRLVKEFVEFYEKSYTNLYFNSVSPDILDLRKQVCFIEKMIIYRVDMQDEFPSLPQDMDDFSVTVFPFDQDANIRYMLIEAKRKIEIAAKVLYKKKFDIFTKDVPHREIDKDKYEQFKSLILENQVVDDNPNNLINSSDLFEISTLLLINNKVGGLDYKKCKELKIKIEEEIQRSKEMTKIFEF